MLVVQHVDFIADWAAARTWLTDAAVACVGDVVAGDGVRSARPCVRAEVDVLAVAPVAPRLTVAHVAPVDAVAHGAVQTAIERARVVQLAAVAVEARATRAREVCVARVAAEAVVLTRPRRARVEARAVAPKEPVVAEALVPGVF